jgi:hypothetical protein
MRIRSMRALTISPRRANPAWLDRLITRRVPLAHWNEALERRDDDIKVVLDFAA